jgi:hypothetical protein
MAIVLILDFQLFVLDASAEITPSAEMQNKLKELFVANGDAEWKTKEAPINAFAAELSNAAPKKRHFVLEQLVYFTAYEDAYEKNKETPFAISYLFEKATFSNDEVLAASIEHWIGADDRLKKAINGWAPVAFQSAEDSFDELIPYLQKSQGEDGELSEAAIAYMYDRSAKRALLTLERLSGSDEEGIERLREEVSLLPEPYFGSYKSKKLQGDQSVKKGLLEKLSADERWWVRYYALSVAGPVKELSSPDLMRRLSNDPHVYVKRAASRFPKNHANHVEPKGEGE